MILNFTSADMIDQATVDILNQEVAEILDSGEGQISATDAIDEVIFARKFVVVDTTNPDDTDGGYVELLRAGGQYAIVWLASQFGSADDVFTSSDYESAALGFDNQTLGWAA